MRARRSTTLTLVAIATLALGACGSPGSGGGEADPTSSGTSGLATCDPIAGDKLVVLEDDKGLQNAENLVPIVNTKWLAAHKQAEAALDALSAVLTTEDLTTLIGQVQIGREKAPDVAEAYLKAKGLLK